MRNAIVGSNGRIGDPQPDMIIDERVLLDPGARGTLESKSVTRGTAIVAERIAAHDRRVGIHQIHADRAALEDVVRGEQPWRVHIVQAISSARHAVADDSDVA